MKRMKYSIDVYYAGAKGFTAGWVWEVFEERGGKRVLRRLGQGGTKGEAKGRAEYWCRKQSERETYEFEVQPHE